jgi:hypothetical protein
MPPKGSEKMGLEHLRKVLNRSIYLGVIYTEMIVNSFGVDEMVKGNHGRWK